MKKREALRMGFFAVAVFAVLFAGVGQASAQTVRIVLPERFRVITDQLFDLRVEVEGISSVRARVQVFVENENGQREELNFAGPLEQTANNDNNPNTLDRAVTYRLASFSTPGLKTIQAVVTDGRRIVGTATQVSVQQFNLQSGKNIVLFIGDAMGQAYRDSTRIVAQSTAGRFREGFFDELLEMDEMPVTGTYMTYGIDQIVPDSANSGAAWATGNKTANNYVNVFPDNTDFRFSSSNAQGTKQFALDNPRVETLWQYLKRRHNYKTGIVATSEITDATPAVEGSHTATRSLQNDIARQYVDGSMTPGVTFDVIMGGARERFTNRTVANSGDTRNLVTELQAQGFTYVQTRTELNAINTANPPNQVIGLFRTGNMDVAYDKLGLSRPSDESQGNVGLFPDQPFLDEMTEKAIAVLQNSNRPFILMVEAASIDKQSHPNFAAGQIWDNIEFDKAIGVGRRYLNSSAQSRSNTLLITTADHDQSMHIIGTVDAQFTATTPTLPNPNPLQNVIATLAYPNGSRGQGNVESQNAAGEVGRFPDYNDADGDRYPENRNRFRIKVGYRTGNHTGSSVPVTAEGTGALLFFGHYDQTDLFFKMARVLSLDTTSLDAALQQKLQIDVPRFNPATQLRVRRSRAAANGVEMQQNAPVVREWRYLTEEDDHGHAEENARQKRLNEGLLD